MTDKLSKERRSWNMSRIAARDTKTELCVRSALHRLGFRFRLHRTDLPRKPDIVLPRYRTVIFVHGCFWHRHEDCKNASTPATRREFWEQKFSRNVERDREVQAALLADGWNVYVIWECEVRSSDLDKKLLSFFPDKHGGQG